MVTFTTRLNLSISDTALLSWIKSSRRLSACPNCGRRAHIRRGFIICGRCNRGWPVEDIQDIIAEIEADTTNQELASSRVTARDTKPSPGSNPGLTVSSRPAKTSWPASGEPKPRDHNPLAPPGESPHATPDGAKSGHSNEQVNRGLWDDVHKSERRGRIY